MPRDFPRTRRVGDQIQRELAVLIRDQLKDPRLGLVTVSAVEVSRDLAYAKVFVTLLGEEEPERRDEMLTVLNRAAGFLRHQLGQSMKLRTVPQLRFLYDDSIDRGSRLDSLIEEAVAKDRERRGE
ncbi:30S ribosome-binding factor RbfA [Thiohalobacter sp. IOR34]|uniref:30S ribosome-binding factor RbfA n=1 Tax=Thiohalobacter sp. IOR34 TaxID=3057176 RepID=UPI0025B1950D|nr:30S ribosome-binding factor RbfA [Thiohalobacter sp. IOR34]WJW76515.1 30S ribosome-binding factor RbfA [Thiohalobacter sp. IOR34]